MTFRAQQISRLAESGWSSCASVARAVAAAGLPAITPDYLDHTFDLSQWDSAEAAVTALGQHFGSARFADEVEYGVLLVPDPARLDTRGPMPPVVREDQLQTAGDVFDERLPAGVLGIGSAVPWSIVVTVTGVAGLSLGSHDNVANGPAGDFTVLGTDTRKLMIRQLWGARVLQSGRRLPDCEANPSWTFTLFPGEPLTDGCAESGTVLKGRVRFRLGRTDRKIGPARVAPAIAV